VYATPFFYLKNRCAIIAPERLVMFRNFAKVLGGNPYKREMERLGVQIEKINALEPAYEKLDRNELLEKTRGLRLRLANGESLDQILPEAFAAVREASKRTIGLRHYDIQLLGGIVLHEGKIAEMRTGEGKTLVATLPLYLNAFSGKGVHLVTVNDYLARRDARWMAPIYHMLGMSVGVLQMSSQTGSTRDAYLVNLDQRNNREEKDQLQLVHRKEAYLADITYGTNNEFGFDYLRDNLVMDISSRVQRGHHYSIIDEVDNILIDEARTPLIISGPASEDVEWYSRMAQVVKQLGPEDYDFDEKDRSVALTEIGEAHVEDLLKIPLRDPDRPEDITAEQARLLGYLEQALRAQLLYRQNKDYIIQNGQVIIVDEFTGRLMPGRRWSEGLHQAIEAKEGVKVNPENVTHATITLQNYFRKYEKLAGMTGTALTEAEEFSTIYKLDVIEIPTNLDHEAGKTDSDLSVYESKYDENYSFVYYAQKNDPDKKPIFWKRKDYPDVVYRSEEGKLRAIVLEILKYHVMGRPQLVGTTSIEHSERLSQRLHAEMLRKLLMTVLVREAYFRFHHINMVERAIRELDFLNESLPQLKVDNMRAFGHKVNLESINPESAENLYTILSILGLDDNHHGRLEMAVQGGVPHQVLNALKHDQESQIIAGAGAFSAVTIATNMAGRGVDIKLGGEIEESVLSDIRHVLNTAGFDPYSKTQTEMAEKLGGLSLDAYGDLEGSIHQFLNFQEDMRRVRSLGGLHVIGSERHEARRIDNQLRGRSARQGDPGSSRFYLSLEDDLMRMFGGERAENMMRIFNLDPSIPLESRMLGRLVEGAQERVEGYNFDIRKHLLEYDDVLNDQRERIYVERDRVLTKEDLEEDVLEMLRGELQRRIPDALADPEGPWKLLAFLEEVQPTIFYPQQNDRLLSYPLTLAAKSLAEKINLPPDSNQVKSKALELARETMLAEQTHIIYQTQAFIERTMESFNRQMAERLEMLNVFLENVENNQTVNMNDLNAELQNLVKVKVSLDRNMLQDLGTKPDNVTKSLTEKIEAQLLGIYLSRLVMTIERRISSRLGVDVSALLNMDWPTIESQIIRAVEQIYAARIETLTRPGNQIFHNIESIISHQTEKTLQDLDLVELTAGMAIGTQLVIDPRTHQRVSQRVNVLNYIFIAAKTLEGKNPDEIAEDILSHLENTQKRLRSIWGKMEIQRLSETNATLADLDEDYRRYLSQPVSAEILHQPLSALLENHDAISAFGRIIQNRIYRHILLQEISSLWIEHLTSMEALRVSIGMEAYAQRDPLVQYKNQSTETFRDLLSAIRMGVISKMFRLQPAKPQQISSEPVIEKVKKMQVKESSGKKKRKRHKKR